MSEHSTPASTLDPDEVLRGRETLVGSIRVRRSLPHPRRRTVGAWCFADHMGPASVTATEGLGIGPHPHFGLSTLTWLIDGEVLHRDSLGTQQVISPGSLNLMTAGRGVSHSEEATGTYAGELQGIQLWIALPDSTRGCEPAFEHHASLPELELDGANATVLIGEFENTHSSARHDSAIVGVDLDLRAKTTIPLRAEFEHGLIVLEGKVRVGDSIISPGSLTYIGVGRDQLQLDVRERTRAILLGGQPWEEPVLMWWNFVARERSEIDDAYSSWNDDDGRFGTVASPLSRIRTPAPYWQRSKERP